MKVAPKPKVTVTFAAKGCYRDTGRRDLPKYMGYSKTNSKAQCGNKCNAKGFRYFATQYSGQCFCSNTFGKYGKSKNCNMKCGGNKKEICGGGWANNVYQIVRGTGRKIKIRVKVSTKKVGKKGKKLVKKAKKIVKKVAKKGKKAAKKVIKKVVKKAKKAVKKAKKTKSAKKVKKAKKALKVVKKIAKKAAKKGKRVVKKAKAAKKPKKGVKRVKKMVK